jgi:tetratricopeptide (TPR) repeat protein
MTTNLESILQKGREHLDAREWEEAARCFREALLLQPDFPEAEEGWSHAQRGLNAELAYNRGLRFFEQGRWEEGIAQLEEANASGIEFLDLPAELKFARLQQEMGSLHKKALQHEKAGQWTEAVATLKNLYKSDENYEQASERLAAARDELELQKAYERCQTQIERKNWGSALDIIREIEQKRPDYPNIQSLKFEAENNNRWERWAKEATHHEHEEDWEEAFALYKEILQENPDFPGLPERLAEARRQRDLKAAYEGAENYLKQEEWDLAREGFEWVLAQAPGYKEAEAKCEIAQNALEGHKRLDEVDRYLEADVLAKARKALDEASRLVPPDSSLYKRLVETQERCEERERKLKQTIDNELREADEAFVKRSLVEAQRILRRAKERYPGYKEKEIEDRLRTIEEALRPRRPKWVTVLTYVGYAIAVLAGIAGILDFLLGGGIFKHIFVGGPTATPSVIVTAVLEPTLTATDTPIPIPTDTPTSSPYPTPALVSPEGTSFPKGQDVKLVWEWERDLAENEFFEVRIRLKGEQKFDPIGLTKMSSRFVPASRLTQAGTYEWQVAIVSLLGEEKGVSRIWSFEVK